MNPGPISCSRHFRQPCQASFNAALHPTKQSGLRAATESDISHLSEDKAEMGTNACLEEFLSGCLKETELGFLTDDREFVWYVDDTLQFKLRILMETAMRGIWK